MGTVCTRSVSITEHKTPPCWKPWLIDLCFDNNTTGDDASLGVEHAWVAGWLYLLPVHGVQRLEQDQQQF